MTEQLEQKFKEYFADHKVVVAFSGGVDSAVLAALANKYAKEAIAVTMDSPVIPPGETEAARRLAKEIGIRQKTLYVNELENERFVENPSNRC